MKYKFLRNADHNFHSCLEKMSESAAVKNIVVKGKK
jgi:hypothetical protein